MSALFTKTEMTQPRHIPTPARAGFFPSIVMDGVL